MAIQWTEALAVGIDDIDAQHKELFRQADRLLEASQKGIGMEELNRTLAFLGKYVVDHFGTEERYMDRFGYPASLDSRAGAVDGADQRHHGCDVRHRGPDQHAGPECRH